MTANWRGGSDCIAIVICTLWQQILCLYLCHDFTTEQDRIPIREAANAHNGLSAMDYSPQKGLFTYRGPIFPFKTADAIDSAYLHSIKLHSVSSCAPSAQAVKSLLFTSAINGVDAGPSVVEADMVLGAWKGFIELWVVFAEALPVGNTLSLFLPHSKRWIHHRDKINAQYAAHGDTIPIPIKLRCAYCKLCQVRPSQFRHFGNKSFNDLQRIVAYREYHKTMWKHCYTYPCTCDLLQRWIFLAIAQAYKYLDALLWSYPSYIQQRYPCYTTFLVEKACYTPECFSPRTCTLHPVSSRWGSQWLKVETC